MLHITSGMKVLFATEPADFRRRMNGLARLCRESLRQDPFAEVVFASTIAGERD